MRRIATLLVLAGIFMLSTGCGDGDGDKPVNPPKAPGGAKTGKVVPDKIKPADLTIAKVRVGAGMAAAFLISKQNKDGSFGSHGPSVGMTGLAVVALAETKAGGKAGAAVIEKAVAWMLKFKQPDGGVYIKGQPYNSYETSITVMALAAVDKARYQDVIDGCVNYLKGIQDDGSKKASNKGGIGYGSKGVNSNVSTTHYALQAFKAAGLKEDDEAWKKAVAFISICQNQAETNKMEYAAVINDGGFIYSPGESKAGKKTLRGKVGWKSYGSMTYAGYLSYVYAKLSPEDQRVKGAEKWISNNYTLAENPAMGGQGLYYYYHTFALAFDARGKKTFKLADGKEVEWARDLGAKLLSLQDSDGGWINAKDRWHEGSKIICTGYSLRALGRVIKSLEAK
jgi:squalene-hopene/tetraprenyl-beta-curcumene cyclase